MNAPTPSLFAPHRIHRPVMLQGWKKIAYVHWPVAPGQVQSRLPRGLVADTFDGSAWVGLVAFNMERIRLPGTPAIPYLGTFPETNVRTYVRDEAGRPGVWFDSLDITRLIPVIVARTTYRLPYMWSKMSISIEGERITYRAQRKWPTAGGVSSVMSVHRGAPISDPTPLEAFLTARWGLYTQLGSRLAFAPVEHEPWPLRQASVDELLDNLVAAAGYEVPNLAPLVHYSEGVEVRIGFPREVRI